jgi:ADP-ribose pyrophosphatase
MQQRRYIYKGRILNLLLEDERYEIIEHLDAVAVLAERDGKVLFVQQYRPAIKSHTLEIPAGLIDPGETPEEAAKRELAEETQLSGEMEYLTSFYLSPGYCDEKLHVFRATNLTPAFAEPDEDEEIMVHWLKPQEVLRDSKEGRVEISASAMAGILFYLSNYAADQ